MQKEPDHILHTSMTGENKDQVIDIPHDEQPMGIKRRTTESESDTYSQDIQEVTLEFSEDEEENDEIKSNYSAQKDEETDEIKSELTPSSSLRSRRSSKEEIKSDSSARSSIKSRKSMTSYNSSSTCSREPGAMVKFSQIAPGLGSEMTEELRARLELTTTMHRKLTETIKKKAPSWVASNKFYETTPINGFSFINETKYAAEKIFWYMLIVVFLAITAWDCAVLIMEYMEEPTVSELEVVFDDSFQLNPATLCLPIEEKFIKTMLFNTFQKFGGKEVKITNIMLDNVGHKNWTLASEQLWKDDSKLSTLFFALTYEYFSTMTQAESARSKRLVKSDAVFNSFFNASLLVFEDARSINLTELDVLNLLRVKLIHMLDLRFTHLKIIDEDYYVPVPHQLDIGDISWIDKNKLCFQLNFPQMHNDADAFEISANFRDFMHPGLAAEIANGAVLELDLRGQRISAKTQTDSTARLALGSNHELSVTVTAEYKAMPSPGYKEKRCSDEETRDECYLTCRARLIYDLCKCSAFSTRGFEPSQATELCTRDKYLTCLEYNGDADGACTSKCLNHCSRRTYRILSKAPPTQQSFQSAGPSPRVSVKLQMTSFIFPRFVEVSIMTWQNFTGNFGGVIGLWIGASFVSIIHIVIHIVKNCAHKREGE